MDVCKSMALSKNLVRGTSQIARSKPQTLHRPRWVASLDRWWLIARRKLCWWHISAGGPWATGWVGLGGWFCDESVPRTDGIDLSPIEIHIKISPRLDSGLTHNSAWIIRSACWRFCRDWSQAEKDQSWAGTCKSCSKKVVMLSRASSMSVSVFTSSRTGCGR